MPKTHSIKIDNITILYKKGELSYVLPMGFSSEDLRQFKHKHRVDIERFIKKYREHDEGIQIKKMFKKAYLINLKIVAHEEISNKDRNFLNKFNKAFKQFN